MDTIDRSGRMLAGEPFPIVGIGASAGGLDAFKALLANLPADTGMAFVLVQHLDPMHASLMGHLLTGHTPMPVTQAAEGTSIEPNQIYLIPPGVSLSVADGKLHLSEPLERHGARKAFDFFLRSLADDRGSRAAGVVLSGTGTDGRDGLKAVKKKGGFVVVQDPTEATFDGMPKSAIESGEADLVLPIAAIPAALIQHFAGASPGQGDSEKQFFDVLDLVGVKTGHDFSLYKTGTLARRIARRAAIAGTQDLSSYVARLESDDVELRQLADDLLINVTQFFRDPAAFDALALNVLPQLIEAQPRDQPLRIWVPGCSTGEEAYSLTILFLEALSVSGRNIKLQVFASDVNARSVAHARAGTYGSEVETRMSPERLHRFFRSQGNRFRVSPELRDAVVFTIQDLLADPPFSRLDFISCRNLLIYLRPEAQHQVLSLFDFALRPGGVLFLGGAETLGQLPDRFRPLEKKHRIFRHVAVSRPGKVELPKRGQSRERLDSPSAVGLRKTIARAHLRDLTAKLLLSVLSPTAVLVDEHHVALFYTGEVDRYLRLAPGEAQRNVLTMAREGLRPKLRAALEGARQTGELTWESQARLLRDGVSEAVKIGVCPVPSESLFLIIFAHDVESTPEAPEPRPAQEETSRVLQLEQELDETRKELNTVIGELEISNEELRAANDEALSINEEFQSTNEELETSKEELQSLNEELTALNGQLQETLEQQRSTAADLQNILNSSDIATLFLDAELKIRFYTSAARPLFNVIGADIGRPLVDLAKRIHDPKLMDDARAVLANGDPQRREIEGHDGNWYIRSVLPYQTSHGSVEGVVITFACTSELKAAEKTIEAAKRYAEGIIATVKQPLVVLDEELHVVSASASFFKAFHIRADEAVGKTLTLGGQLKPETVAAFLVPVKQGKPIEDLELEIDLARSGRRTLHLSAREIVRDPFEGRKLLVAIDDVTDARAEADALALARDEALRANLVKSKFLAAASHDLRQPLQTMSLLRGMLADDISDQATLKLIDRLGQTIAAMSGLLDKLLDINQLEAGVVQPQFVNFDIGQMFAALQAEFEIHARDAGLELRVVPCSCTIRSDPRLLEQILRNLIANAIRYTHKGKVLLGCRHQGRGHLRVEVWDSGSGIPHHQLEAIFKEGHQVDNGGPSRGKGRGLGLGLSIVQRLADLLELPVSVRSRPDRGSCFALEVPITDHPPQSPGGEPPPEHRGEGRRGLSAVRRTILILEDNADVSDTLKLLLTKLGFRTLVARDCAQALSIAADSNTRIDLVIADYNLPGPDGLKTLAMMEEATERTLPAILLTGDISAATLREIAEKHYTHLYKPADASSLIRHIERTLHLASREAATQTVFIVDDNREVREAMRDTLESHGYQVAIFPEGAAFLEAFEAEQAGCVVLDLRMPGMSGLELVELLTKAHPSPPIIVITGYGDIPTAVRAMRQGASYFLEKPVRQDELLEAVEEAMLSSGELKRHNAQRQSAAARLASLTARQRQILELVLAGSASKNIAVDLGISQRTVENHRAAIMRKVGVKSLSGLIRAALSTDTE